MPISVIVSNFNGAMYLPRLIESLKSQQGVMLEIIVVERNSTDASSAILAEHPDVKIVKEPPESGLVSGYHAGTLIAQYEHLFFCNEDMWFSIDCLSRLEHLLHVRERSGAAMPAQLTYAADAVVNTGVWFRRSRWDRGSPFPFRRWVFKITKQASRVSGINAGACLVRRIAYDEVGGWDTTFFLDYEDGDFSLRLWQRGWECYVEPHAFVFHAVGASNNKRIESGTTRVGTKRYVSQFSNQLAIILKYFQGLSLVFALLLWVDRFLRDLLRGRFYEVWLDCRVVYLTIKRLPAILRHRGENHDWNIMRPGQHFYCDPAFDADTVPNVTFQSMGEFLVRVRSKLDSESLPLGFLACLFLRVLWPN